MLNRATALQIFQLLRVGSSILTGVLLAKSSLSASDIGAFESLLFIGTTASFFWVNGLMQAIAPLYAQRDTDGQKRLLQGIFWTFALLAAGIGLVFYLFESPLTQLLCGKSALLGFAPFTLYLCLNLLSYPVESVCLVQNRSRELLVWGVFSFGGHLLCAALPLLMGWQVEAIFYSLSMLAALKALWSLRRTGAYLHIPLDQLRPYLNFSWPLILSGLASNFMLMWDNWLVSHGSNDLAVFAQYRFGARELPIALPLCTALSAAMVPILLEKEQAGLLELKRRSLLLMHLLFPLSIILMFSAKWLYPRIFNPDFVRSADVFNVFLLATATRILLPGAILLAKGENKLFFPISLAELLLRILLTSLLFQYLGLVGVAWGVILSFWVEKLILGSILYKKYSLKPGDWLDLRWYAFYLIALMGAYWIASL